ncbi:TRAP-type C4-dicarboxylate transport system, substrate-binding protein [Pseudosulfitobacter pseudonitzschiae]|uniref:ABC transporter substrate-binding protein n=1 Tax=Pseudosulfitobacter pseudonitzschiae TaxID=1402135 RepID=A0A073JC43_9RHOB|nr:TRAP transporter substrate-binding protein [Pseudosulfitobacter pseudonitzschiae]KEJ95302.1 ABC transporter substrate-binding protein [Pseudosulfitobacter pseudonitzschiae]QKS11545.1 TRAP transporter substrate-binding protein [Pseudosulfitobacter pseudonitzschiae]SHF91373.1 TRAP-type C4-dicarboxylate transport system, substrate-binding protein [Pseudosulfitobacter pseudonitzschiae]
MNYLKTLGAAVVAAVTFGNIATAETTWVMASGYPDDSFFTQNIRTFIEEVEAASDGELKIDLRSNGELIKLDAIRRAVQAGQIQLGEIRFGVYGNESPMFTLDSLPNVAGNYDDAWKLMEAQKPWFDKVFGDAGMQVISYAPWPGQGFYTKFDVTDGSQFEGVKLRIYSPATQRMGELLGFQATILPFAEVPQAFSTGLIEALFTSGQTGTDIQAWDYVSNFTYTGSMHNKNAIIISERALSALSPELQEAIIAAGERATERAWELSKEATETKRQELIDAGMVVTDASPELQAKLEEIGKAMVEEWSASASPEEVEVLNNYLAAKN